MIEHYVNQIIAMNILADAVTIIDDKGIIQYYKVFQQEASPFAPSEIIGRHFLDVFTNINPSESSVLKALRGESSFHNHFEVIHKDGSRHEIVENVYPVRFEGKIIGAVCVSQNAATSKKYLDINLPKATAKSMYKLKDIIGNSPKLRYLKMQIAQLAATDTSILVYGETGTGKEMVAEAIHGLSRRSNKQFCSQNCAAIPGGLAESLLFGTKKGVYTGSVDSPGIFEQVNGGTLFLDEVNSLDYSIQAKLLRALETKKIHRLGSDKEISLDFRVVAATNEDPFKCMESGKIRSDLFYRLSTFVLEIPPLRERKEDIPLLTEHFIQAHNEASSKQFSGVSDEVLAVFKQYSWPGNVRELKNVIESSAIFAKSSTIQISDLPYYITKSRSIENKEHRKKNSANFLPASTSAPSYLIPDVIEQLIRDGATYKEAMDRFENLYLDSCQRNCSNQTHLAHILGISRQSLINKLKKHNLRPCDGTRDG